MNLQCRNITCIDLQQSHCTPAAIIEICTEFPSLQSLSISTEYGISPVGRPRSHEHSFTAGLAKLEHLQELVLELHYKDDVKAWMGPHGVLNLAGLSKLASLRLPLHFLVETQTDQEPFITDLGLALPPGLEQLTVWADTDIVRRLGFTVLASAAFRIQTPYGCPSQSAVDFLNSVAGCVTGHLKSLKRVAYCYRDQALGTPCCCDEDILCNHHVALQLLDPHAHDESSARIQILSSRLEAQGVVCLCTLEDQDQDQDPPPCEA